MLFYVVLYRNKLCIEKSTYSTVQRKLDRWRVWLFALVCSLLHRSKNTASALSLNHNIKSNSKQSTLPGNVNKCGGYNLTKVQIKSVAPRSQRICLVNISRLIWFINMCWSVDNIEMGGRDTVKARGSLISLQHVTEGHNTRCFTLPAGALLLDPWFSLQVDIRLRNRPERAKFKRTITIHLHIHHRQCAL